MSNASKLIFSIYVVILFNITIFIKTLSSLKIAVRPPRRLRRKGRKKEIYSGVNVASNSA